MTKRSAKVAQQEQEATVAAALEKAADEAQKKLTEELAKAEKVKEQAVDKAVKAALEEAAKPESEEDS